jgi:TPR repeat protein
MKSIAAAALLALAVPAFPTVASAGVKEGVDAWQAGNYPKAIAEWRGPAEAGDADAQFNLAQAYKLGRGVPADLRAAQDWYSKAAAQGHEQAQANLGLILFQNGDRKGALPWIQKAADRGEPRAQYVLGTAHFNGDLVPKDWPKAYALMTRAAASGLPQAATSLAQMDQYIPLAQRQQGITMAKAMDKPAPPPSAAVAKPPASTIKPVALPPSAPAAPASKPVIAAPKPVPTAAGWRVQLGAFASEAAARSAWSSVSGKAAALKGLQPYVVRAGSITRLQAGPLATRAAADRACQAAKAAGSACFVVKS